MVFVWMQKGKEERSCESYTHKQIKGEEGQDFCIGHTAGRERRNTTAESRGVCPDAKRERREEL